jgi:hypothetical protein
MFAVIKESVAIVLSCIIPHESIYLLTLEILVLCQSSPRGVLMGRVAMAQVFLRVLPFSPVTIIPP